MADRGTFICGVVEGFYGRPWTTDQRKELFRRIEKMGMNSYVYAPKDDLKHRAYWRDLYTVEEADHLQSLIEAAKQHNVRFYYALSPGLDICYSSQKEVNAIKQKLEQVRCLGCEWFALLFDDIEPTMSDVDKQKFTSFAEAQVSVTNEVFDHLHQPQFMFCPTEYCESRALPSLENSDYLNYIGRKLAPDINILWTGPRVISRTISAAHLSMVQKVLRRKPLIWDNLHANDYDNKRVFLGPYAGRPALIKLHIAGVVTNPNCEFEANFVAMHTLAQWNKCVDDADIPKDDDATLEAGGDEKVVTQTKKSDNSYHPIKALKLALDEWLPEISAHRMAFAKLIPSQISSLPSAAGLFSVTSTMSSTSSISTDTSVVYSSSAAGILPLYTPPAIAESVTNPYMPPPLVENTNGSCTTTTTTSTSTTTTMTNQTPVLTIAMQAVNSLTDEYCEPMELAPPSTSGSQSEVENSPRSNKKLKTIEECVAACNSIVEAAVVEMRENKSADNLTDLVDNLETNGDTKNNNTFDVSPMREVAMSDDDAGDESSAKRRHYSTNLPLFDGNMQIDKDEPTTTTAVAAAHEEMISSPPALFNRTDLQLMCELFYLPFEHGPRANFLIDEFLWLRSNASVVRQSQECLTAKLAEEWTRRASEFDHLSKIFTDLCVRLVDCPNRGLVYDFYPYVFDLQGVLNSLNCFVKWLGCGYYCDPQKQSTMSNGLTDLLGQPKNASSIEGEPWTVRRALMTEFQRLLPLENAPDLFVCRPPHPPCGRIFRARPYSDETDRKVVYEICRTTMVGRNRMNAKNHNELIGDRYVGAFLELCSEYCFVLEEMNGGVVGFALGALDAQRYYDECKYKYLPRMQIKYDRDSTPSYDQDDKNGPAADDDRARNSDDDDDGGLSVKNIIDSFYNVDQTLPQSLHSRYPSLIIVNLLPHVFDTVAPKRLLVALFSALKVNGSQGVYCEVRKNDRFVQETYSRWNFFEITMLDEEAVELNYYGRVL